MKKPLIFVGLIGLFVALGFWLPYEELFRELSLFVGENRVTARMLYCLVYVTAVVFLVPGSLLTLLGGFLFGIFEGVILVSLSSVVGAGFAFLIGRYFAREWVESRTRNLEGWLQFDRAISSRGFYIVLMTRLSPVFPFNLLNYTLGLTMIRFRDYVLASWLGMVPATVLYVYFGSVALTLTDLFAGESTGSYWQYGLMAIGLIATLGLVVVLTRLASSILKKELGEPT